MASARITQTIHADGSVTTTMTVTCDVLDSHETVEESVRNTGVLWFVTQGDDEDEDSGQEHLGGVERGLDARHSVADPTDLLGLGRIPAQEGVLAADAALG